MNASTGFSATTILKEIKELNDAITELDSLITKEAEFVQRLDRVAKIDTLKSRIAAEIKRVQEEEDKSERNFNTGKLYSSVAGFALGSILGAMSKQGKPFLSGAKLLSTELGKEADFGTVLIATGENSKLEDIEVVSISSLAREYKKTESSIISIIKGNGYLLLTPEELWKSLHRLKEDIMEGKYKSEREQNKALFNYAKKRK